MSVNGLWSTMLTLMVLISAKALSLFMIMYMQLINWPTVLFRLVIMQSIMFLQKINDHFGEGYHYEVTYTGNNLPVLVQSFMYIRQRIMC